MQREAVELSQCLTFMYGVLLLRGGDACCIPFNKHTEEDQLAEDMQEDERERLTMMNDLCIDELLVSTNFCYCWN